jgi:hypothetical protein
VRSEGCTALPGAVEFANHCVENGVALFYVTNRYDQGYKQSEAGYAGQEGYKKADGGFAHSYYWGTPNHQGLPISTRENAGDVDATTIAVGTAGVIFDALGLKRMPVLMHSDYMRYINILENLPPVTKTRFLDPLIDFENGRNHTAFTVGGAKFSLEPFGDSHAMKVSFGGTGGAFRVTYTAHSWDGEMYLFDGRLAFAEDTEGKDFKAIYLNSKEYAPIELDLRVREGKVLLGSELYGMPDFKAVGEVGKAFTLRLEYRSSYEPLAGTLDVYVNDEYIGKLVNENSTDPKKPSGYPANAIQMLDLKLLSEGDCTAYFDDVQFYYAKEA